MARSILGRLSQLVRANVNALIDSAEDPEKMLDQLVRDFTASITEAEAAVAQTIGNLRLLEDDRDEAKEAVGEWGRKAAAAAQRADGLRGDKPEEADRFDELAKIALRKLTAREVTIRRLRPRRRRPPRAVERMDGPAAVVGAFGSIAARRSGSRPVRVCM
jgi:phage shock protein A